MADASIKQYVFQKGSRKGIPVSGTFELTSRCNLNCKMCYIHTQSQDKLAKNRELTAKQWLQLGRQAADAGMIYLLLTGGEPMLRPDFPEIYSGLAEMGIVLSVNTNAVMLNSQILDAFARYIPEKVNVTLYGMSEQTYGSLCGVSSGFQKAVQNIRVLKEAGIKVNINTTFTRLNIDDMEAIVDFARQESIPVRMASYLFPPVRGGCGAEDVFLSPEEMGAACAEFDRMTLEPEDIEKRRKLMRKIVETPVVEPVSEKRSAACTAGRGSFWITWDGKMYPCGMLTAGVDVVEQDFKEAWQQTREKVKQYLLPEECLTCGYKKLCPYCVAVTACAGVEDGSAVQELCRKTKTYAAEFLK